MASETSVSDVDRELLKSIEEQLQELEGPSPALGVSIKSERPATPVAKITNSGSDQRNGNSSNSSVSAIQVTKDIQQTTSSACVIKQEPRQDLQPSSEDEVRESRSTNVSGQPVAESKNRNEETDPFATKENNEHGLPSSKTFSAHVDAKITPTAKISTNGVSKIKAELIEPSDNNMPEESRQNQAEVTDKSPKRPDSNEAKNQSEPSGFSKETRKLSASATNSSIIAKSVEIKSEQCSNLQEETSKQDSSNKIEPAKYPNICVIPEAATVEHSKPDSVSQKDQPKAIDDNSKEAAGNGETNQREMAGCFKETGNSSASATNTSVIAEPVKIKSEECSAHQTDNSMQESSNKIEPARHLNICALPVSCSNGSKENALPTDKTTNAPEKILSNKEKLSDSKDFKLQHNAEQPKLLIHDNVSTTPSKIISDSEKMDVAETSLLNTEKLLSLDKNMVAYSSEDTLKVPCQLPSERKSNLVKVETVDLSSKERFEDVLKDLGESFELKSNEEKMEELRKYIPFLERWVKKLKATNSNTINNQLMKIETLLAVLANRRKSHDAASIAKFKAAIINLQKAACSTVQIPKPRSIKIEKTDTGYDLVSKRTSNNSKPKDACHAIETSIQTISLDSDDSDDDITFHTVEPDTNKNLSTISTTKNVKKEPVPMEVDGIIDLSDDESVDFETSTNGEEKSKTKESENGQVEHAEVLPKLSDSIVEKENIDASNAPGESSCNDVTELNTSDKLDCSINDCSDAGDKSVEQSDSTLENPALNSEVEKERIITQLQQKILSLTSNVQPKVPEADGELAPKIKTEIAWPSLSDCNTPLCIDLLDSDSDDDASKGSESRPQKTIDLEKLAEKPAEELIPIWLKMAQECGIKPSIATDLWGGNACINLVDDDDKVSESSHSDTQFDDPITNDNLIEDLPSKTNSEEAQNELRKSASPSFSPPPQTPAPCKMTFDSAVHPNTQNTPMVTFPQDPRSSYNTKPISSFNNSRRSMPMVSVPKNSENNCFDSGPFSHESANLNLANNATPKDPRLNAENSRCYGSNTPTAPIKPAQSIAMQPIQSRPMQPIHSMSMHSIPAMSMQPYPSMSMQPVHRMPIQPVQPMPMQQNPFDQLRMNNNQAYNPPKRNQCYNNNYSSSIGSHLNKPYRPNPFKTQPQWNSQNYSNNYNIDRKGPSNSFEKNRPSVSYTAAPYNYGSREEKKEYADNIRTPSTPTKPAYDSIIDKAYRSNDFDAAIKAPVGFKIPKKPFSGPEELPAAARIRNEYKAEFIKLGRGKNDKKGKFSDSIDMNQEISPECEMVPSVEPLLHDGKKKKEKNVKKKPQKKGSKNSLENKKVANAKRKIESDSESSSDDYTFSMDNTFAQAASSSDSSDEVEKTVPKKGRKPKSKQNASLTNIAENFKMFSQSAELLPKLQLFCLFNQLLSGEKIGKVQKALQAFQSINIKEEPAKKRKKAKSAQTKTEAVAKKMVACVSKELDKGDKNMFDRSSPDDIFNVGIETTFQNPDNVGGFSGEVNTPSEPIYFRQIAKKRWKRMKTNDSVVGYSYTPKHVDDDSDLTDYYYDYPSKHVSIQKRVKSQFRYSLEPVLCLPRCDGAGDPTPLLVPLKEIPYNDDAKRNKKKSWMMNTDRSRHCRSSYVEKCVICKKPKEDIVSHYVNQHKNTEVFISRLSQKDLNDIAKHPNEFNQAKTYEAKCVFCREIHSFNLKFWHQHLSEHTGEYAYQCNACDLLGPKKPPLIYHTKNECDPDARVHKIYHFDVQSGKISLYACVHCNYVQLYKENIMQHLKTEHEHNKPADADCREIIVFKVTNPNMSKAPTQSNENTRMDIDEESLASVRDVLGMDDGGDISTSDFDEGNDPVQIKVEISSERAEISTTEASTTEAAVAPSLPEATEEITTEDAVFVKQEPSEILPNLQQTVIKSENAMEIDEECSMRNSVVFDQNSVSQEDSEQLYQPAETPQVQAVPVATSSATRRSYKDPNRSENNVANEGNETEDVKPIVTKFNVLPSMEMCLKPWAMHSYNTVYKKDKKLCKELEKSSNICALYKCSKKDCVFTTDSDVLFRDHVSTHGYIFLECPYCDTKVPTNIAELIVHIEEHKTDFFQCSNCFYRSCSAYNVYLHQNMYHFQDADRKIYICLAHSTYSTGSLGMTRGECISRIDDVLANRATNVPKAKCRLCSQSYYLKSSLLSHAKAAHKIDVTDEIFNSVGVFVCLYCGYETDYIWNIRRHLMQHHPQKLTIVTARLQNACPQLKGVVQQNILSSTMLINVSEVVAEKLISLPPKTTFVDPDYEKMEKNLRLAINSLDIRKNYKLSKLFAENYSECFMNFDGTDVGLKDNLTVYKRSLGEDSKVKTQKNFADLYLFINPILATRGYESADLYYCCDTPHASAETYFTHLQTKAHNKGLMIKCNQCNGCYDIAFLRNHILFHRKPRYICFACGFVCATADGIQTHFTTNHRKIKGRLRCIVISVLHVYEAFLNDEDENDNEYYYVVNCESTKLSRQKFTEYIVELFERHHEGSLFSNPLTGTMITIFPNNVKIPDFVSHEIRYACSICGLSQNNFDELETHLRQEHLALTENYSCHHCKAKLPMYDSCYYRIKRHIELHGISVFQCNVCRYFHYDREIMLHHCKYFHTSNNIAIFSHVRRGKDSVKEEFEIVQNNLLGVTNNSSLRQNFECPGCKEFNIEDFNSFSNHLKNHHNTALIYKCGYCETKGSEENAISNHLKSKHPSKSRDVRLLFNTPPAAAQASGSGTTAVPNNPPKKSKSSGKLRLVSLDKLK